LSYPERVGYSCFPETRKEIDIALDEPDNIGENPVFIDAGG